MNLKEMFRSAPATAPATAPRLAVVVTEELSLARASIEPIAAKLASAQGELAEAQRNYDDEMRAYALGQRRVAPDRGEMQAAISKADALGRIHAAGLERLKHLEGEAEGARASEASEAEGARLRRLTSEASAKLAELERSVSASLQIERELFSMLFDEQSGLRQRFTGTEFAAEAARTRHTLRRRAMDLAAKFKYVLSPRFETDGERNIGAENSGRDFSLPG